jgi:hypothetical protein
MPGFIAGVMGPQEGNQGIAVSEVDFLHVIQRLQRRKGKPAYGFKPGDINL